MDVYLAEDAPAEGYVEAPKIRVSRKALSNYGTNHLDHLCEHDLLSADAGILSILHNHRYPIHQFVRWKAWSDLFSSEAHCATMELIAGCAESSYHQSLQDNQKAECDSGQSYLWMDKSKSRAKSWHGKFNHRQVLQQMNPGRISSGEKLHGSEEKEARGFRRGILDGPAARDKQIQRYFRNHPI
jgi:hypothetical protein